MLIGKEIILSIVIVNFNDPASLDRCIKSIDRHVHFVKEVLVIDNNSEEERLDALQRAFDYLRIIRLPNNTGFGYANNVGVKNARGEIILFLNSDTEIIDDSVAEAIVEFSSDRSQKLWGLKLLWPNGQFQNSFSREIMFIDFILFYTKLNRLGHYVKRIRNHKYEGQSFHATTEVSVIYATAFLMWREDFLELNGFDSRYFMYYEDVDLCDRFRHVLGGKIYYYPFASIIHNVQGSSGGKNRINICRVKSMYRYGLNKYGMAKTFLFMIVHVGTNLMWLSYRVLNNMISILSGMIKDQKK